MKIGDGLPSGGVVVAFTPAATNPDEGVCLVLLACNRFTPYVTYRYWLNADGSVFLYLGDYCEDLNRAIVSYNERRPHATAA